MLSSDEASSSNSLRNCILENLSDDKESFEKTNKKKSAKGSNVNDYVLQLGQKINEAIQKKKRKYEGPFEELSKELEEKMTELYERENKKRRILINKRKEIIKNTIEEWINHLNEFEKEEREMQDLFENYLRASKKCRTVVLNKLKSFLKKNESYFQVDGEMEEKHLEEFNELKNNYKMQFDNFKRKIMCDLKNKEMAELKKSMESIVNF